MARQKPNRGVVLLVVLSLLILFVVIGLTFIVTSTQFRATAETVSKRKRVEEDPIKLIDLSLYQLLRDTPGSTLPSSIHGHSLLADEYGNDGVRGQLDVSYLAPLSYAGMDAAWGRAGVDDNNSGAPDEIAERGAEGSDDLIRWSASSEFVEFAFTFSGLGSQPFGKHPLVDRRMLFDDYFNGAVLTMLDGPMSGHSTRVIDYYVTRGVDGVWGTVAGGTNGDGDDDNNGVVNDISEKGFGDDQFWVRVEAFPSDAGATGLPDSALPGLPGDTFLINGKPFNGTGFGYTPATFNLDAVTYDQGLDGGWGVRGSDDDGDGATDEADEAGFAGSDDVPLPTALLPHFGGHPIPTTIAPDIGGADETYDAVDYQNAFLAMIPADVRAGVIPSFHRPALINFWANHPNANVRRHYWPATSPNWRDHRRKMYFRPMPWDHPNFSGSNPAMGVPQSVWRQGVDTEWGIANVDDDNNGVVDDATEVGWPGSDDFIVRVADTALLNAITAGQAFDVDNTGDGKKDSVWMDIGLPIKTAQDGRQYKPLVAMAVVDLDGRANVNVAGNLHQRPMQNNVGVNPAATSGPNTGVGYLQYTTWLLGADGQPGVAGYDDDGANGADDPGEIGAPGSDDVFTTIAPQLQAPLRYASIIPNMAGISQMIAPRGHGAGPAEMFLHPLLGAETNSLLVNRYSGGVAGDFNVNTMTSQIIGLDDSWSLVKNQGTPFNYSQTVIPVPMGMSTALVTLWRGPDGEPGRANYDDDRNGTTDDLSELGAPFSDDQRTLSKYQSPPDVRGSGATVIDPRGHLTHINQGFANETIDDPYEAVPTVQELRQVVRAGASFREGFSLADLEPVLRYNDGDRLNQFSRLLTTMPYALNRSNRASRILRNSITTHSSDVNSLSAGVPTTKRGAAGNQWPLGTPTNPTALGSLASINLLDLYIQRLQAGGVPPNFLQREVRRLVPFEIRHGLRFDINRLLGNGVDDNNNQVVDEPLESLFGELSWTYARIPTGFNRVATGIPATPYAVTGVPFNHRNNDPLTADPRNTLARHIYCLMMLLMDQGYISPILEPAERVGPNALSTGEQRELTSRRIAQWAINAVDFRDPDATMTIFEYDANPWNGWNVDGWASIGPGPDGAWGRAGVDDDMNMIVDDMTEAGAAGSDDINDTAHPDRRIVLGAEEPHLAMSELMAMHDRRVNDSDQDDGPGRQIDGMSETTMDQYRLPQGSLFVELHCLGNRSNYLSSQGHANNANVHNVRLPHELYSTTGYLELTRIAPGLNPGMPMVEIDRPHPVWQIVIAREQDRFASDPVRGNPFDRLVTRPASTTFDPANLNMIPQGKIPMATQDTPQPMDLDRIIWFTSNAGANAIDPANYRHGDKIFYNYHGINSQLAPGDYFVLGPRRLTRISGTDDPSQDDTNNPFPAQRLQIELPGSPLPTGEFGSFDYTGAANTPEGEGAPGYPMGVTPPPGIIRPIKGMVLAMPPRDWINTHGMAGVPQYFRDNGIGVNISEPLPSSPDFYPDVPIASLNSMVAPNVLAPDAYIDLMTPMPTLPDDPFDSDNLGGAATWRTRPLQFGPGGNAMLATNTYANVRSLFLQRLADPRIPWNPMPGHPDHSTSTPVNPYVTVDWGSTDLTVYNGEDNPGMDPDNTSNPGMLQFASRQRGQVFTTAGAAPRPVNWFSWIGLPWTVPGLSSTTVPDVAQQPNPPGAPASVYFRYSLRHSLGYMNHTEKEVPPPQQAMRLTVPNYNGEPSRPLPMWWWLNRPFANPYELLQVPSSSPDRFFLEYNVEERQFSPNPLNPARVPLDWRPYHRTLVNNPPATALETRRPFKHLLDFFGTSNNQSTPNTAAHFYRLFDYVDTPSPFVGSERYYNPTAFNVPPSPGLDGRWGRAGFDDDLNGFVDDPSEAGWPGTDDLNGAANEFRPPFNKMSYFRDGGMLNLNTVFNRQTLRGLFLGFPELTASPGPADQYMWDFIQKFNFSRRGYHTYNRTIKQIGGYVKANGATANPLELDSRYPTLFANPFRASWASDLMPAIVRSQLTNDDGQRIDGIQATLMRRDSLTPTPGNDRLWGAASADDDGNMATDDKAEAGWLGSDDAYRNEPLFVPNPHETGTVRLDARNQDRNSHMRYLGVQRLSKMTTNHSNVFAVWITVGFFEVEPVSVTAATPDGYRLGREIGSDTGETRRHRGFYIIDRSIPVAFEPGRNHNVDRAILLRRFIQ
ncbi:MAG: hypothetical protein QGG36_24780 [Pirellulaceae bacterium]|jgi:hypothetical protein|nr:hypothetical protein [Pirellulaceae bacterium]MDP7019035.1 hypothetical protein [Pirellulaceae bacterium]